MPTGYTAAIKDGISFETFVMNCARAFGACVTLRDEPGGGEQIPNEFTPSSYHTDHANEARVKLVFLHRMEPEQRERRAAQEWDRAETSRLAVLQEHRKLRESYEAMLAKVKAWEPPTPDHTGLHEFMCEQIEQSISFDCEESYYNTPSLRLTGQQWFEQERERLVRQITHHEKEHAAEVERAAQRTAWVRALRESLKP